MSRICTVSTVDGPSEVIVAWVQYHLAMGVDHMFVFFDNPTHPVIDTVAGERVTCIRCDDSYWPGGRQKREKLTLHERQWYNANKGFQLARDGNFDWIAHIDSDELIYCPESLSVAFSKVPADVPVVRLPVLEFVPTRLESEQPFVGTHWFRVGPRRPAKKALPQTGWHWITCLSSLAWYYVRLGLSKIVCPGARGPFLRGHIGGKSFVRTTATIQGMGVHLPAPLPGTAFPLYFLRSSAILHFDCGTFDQWVRKWESRATEKNIPRNRDPKRRKQLQRYIHTRDTQGIEGLRKLYFKEYGLTPWELRFLSLLGLARRVTVPFPQPLLAQS